MCSRVCGICFFIIFFSKSSSQKYRKSSHSLWVVVSVKREWCGYMGRFKNGFEHICGRGSCVKDVFSGVLVIFCLLFFEG